MMKLKNRRLQFFRDNDPQFAAEGKPSARKVRKDHVKPHRPADLRKIKWVLGDMTEVLHHNSWRLGKITKVLKNDYFVVRITGCIQLREFHISFLRVPDAYCSKQSTGIDRVTEQSKKQSGVADDTFLHSKFVMEQTYEEDGHSTKRHKAVNLCPSTSARILKKKQKTSRMPPDDLIGGASKKRKITAYEVHRTTKKALPLKVFPRNDIDVYRLYKPFSDNRYNDLAKRKPDSKVFPSSQTPLRVQEENKCSVASCSVNCLEYSINYNQQSVVLGSCFPDDAMSACPSISGHENDNVFTADLETDIHELELQAYQSTVRAFYASGPLTWEQELLLTNLRLSLNISNEEHLLQLRHLLSS